MQKWDQLIVTVALDAEKSAYRVVRRGDQPLGEEAPWLSDFLLEMSHQGWEYAGLCGDVVTLRRPHK